VDRRLVWGLGAAVAFAGVMLLLPNLLVGLVQPWFAVLAALLVVVPLVALWRSPHPWLAFTGMVFAAAVSRLLLPVVYPTPDECLEPGAMCEGLGLERLGALYLGILALASALIGAMAATVRRHRKEMRQA
jgi:hypothetical protein